MNKFFKDAAGIAAIAVIIVIIVGIAAGGATILAVRMIVTGEDYLAPFVELGWISADEEDGSSEDDKKGEDAEEVKEVTTLQDASRLSEESRNSDAVQYYGSITSAEMNGYDPTDDYYDLYNSLELEVNLFALDDKAVELVFHIDIAKALKVMYEEYGDEIVSSGEEYDSYEEFEAEYLPYFEDLMEEMLISDDEAAKYAEVYMEDGVLEIYATEEGFESIYETYDIDPDSDNIQDVIDAIEDGLGITLKEV